MIGAGAGSVARPKLAETGLSALERTPGEADISEGTSPMRQIGARLKQRSIPTGLGWMWSAVRVLRVRMRVEPAGLTARRSEQLGVLGQRLERKDVACT